MQVGAQGAGQMMLDIAHRHATGVEADDHLRRPTDAPRTLGHQLYPIVYLDALVVKVRDGHQVRNRAAHIAVGVDLDGTKHVLGIWVQASEGAKFWPGVCAELRNRGVRDVLLLCCDGLTGFAEAIEATWPQATVQTCTVHADLGIMPMWSVDPLQHTA